MLTNEWYAIIVEDIYHHPFEALQKRQVEATVLQSNIPNAQIPSVETIGALHLLCSKLTKNDNKLLNDTKY